MKEIRTKETRKDVKALNKTRTLGKSTKKTVLRTRRRIGDLVEDRQDSPDEYTSDRVQVGARNLVYDAEHRASKAAGEIKDKHKKKARNRRAREREGANASGASMPGGRHPDRRKIKRKKRLAERSCAESTQRLSDSGSDLQARAKAVKEKAGRARIKTSDKASDPRGGRTNVAKERGEINGLERYVERRGSQTSPTGRSAGSDAVKKQEAAKKHAMSRIRSTSAAGTASIHRKNSSIKTMERSAKGIRQSPRSTGKVVPKTLRNSIKTGRKTVKSAETTSRVAVKTSQEVAKETVKAGTATVKSSTKAAKVLKGAGLAVYRSAFVLGKALASILKAIAAGIKSLIAALAAGSSVAMIPLLIICMIGLIVGSIFGIFFSSEDTGSEKTMQQVVQEINAEYLEKLQEEKDSVSYDILEMSGSAAVWREVLAVYAVKVNTDPEDPQEVASLDDGKISTLKDIFWDMNDISSHSETRTETIIVETDDGQGNIVEERHEESKTTLYVTVSHKTAEEMAEQYGFTEEQKKQLVELLSEDKRSMWSAVLYGIRAGGDGEIVAVAQSQLGNEGGQKFWSWYGFNSRVSWCACFVSWCANECGYIEDGIIPKYSLCANAVEWFKDHDQWLDGSQEPLPGMIIFFDWDNHTHTGPQDGHSDHTGIVEKVENGVVYTIEGNSKDSVRERHYNVGHYEIMGYGVPAY